MSNIAKVVFTAWSCLWAFSSVAFGDAFEDALWSLSGTWKGEMTVDGESLKVESLVIKKVLICSHSKSYALEFAFTLDREGYRLPLPRHFQKVARGRFDPLPDNMMLVNLGRMCGSEFCVVPRYLRIAPSTSANEASQAFSTIARVSYVAEEWVIKDDGREGTIGIASVRYTIEEKKLMGEIEYQGKVHTTLALERIE